MTPAQQAIRDAAIAAALEYGYDAKTLRAPPGKFEQDAADIERIAYRQWGGAEKP